MLTPCWSTAYVVVERGNQVQWHLRAGCTIRTSTFTTSSSPTSIRSLAAPVAEVPAQQTQRSCQSRTCQYQQSTRVSVALPTPQPAVAPAAQRPQYVPVTAAILVASAAPTPPQAPPLRKRKSKTLVSKRERTEARAMRKAAASCQHQQLQHCHRGRGNPDIRRDG